MKEFGEQRGLPKLLEVHVEQDENGIRVFIVRDKLEGVTLFEKISSGEKIDRWDIIKQSLQWMIFFEQHNYYHGDIQTSNFIYGKDGKIYPIDYEEIRHQPIVFIWPYKVNLLFLIFMNAVLDLRPEKANFHREIHLLTKLKKHLSQWQYEQISAIKDSEKFFSRLYDILFQSEIQDDKKASYDMRELEFLSTEQFLDDISLRLSEHQSIFGQMHNDMTKLESYIDDMVQIIAAQQKRIERLEKMLQEHSNS